MQKKIWAGVLALVMTICLIPVAAFAEDPVEIQSAKQICEAGGNDFYYDADGNKSSKDSDWAVRINRSLKATGTENLFNVNMEVEAKDYVTNNEKKNAAVTLVLDISNSMNKCIGCGANENVWTNGVQQKCTCDKNNTTRLDAAKKALCDFLTAYASGKGERWVSLVIYAKDAEKKDLCSDSGDQFWVNLSEDGVLEYVTDTITKKIGSLGSTTSTDIAINYAADLLDVNDEGKSIEKIPVDNRFCILLTDGKPTSRLGEDGKITSGTELNNAGSKTAVEESWQAQEACKAVKELTNGNLYTIAYCLSEEEDVKRETLEAAKKNDSDVIESVDAITWLGGIGDTINSDYCGSKLVLPADAENLTDKLKSIIDSELALKVTLANVKVEGAFPYDAKVNEIDLSKFIEKDGVYSFTYPVVMDTKADGFISEKEYPLGDAVLTYTVDGNEITVNFEDIIAKGYLGAFDFVKVDDNDNYLAGAKFEVADDTWNKSAESDENGTVSFTGIPSGFSYVLTETEAPEGYVKADLNKEITVSYGEANIDEGFKVVNTKINFNSVRGTLVTRLNYSDNTKKAKALNGDAFKNGHTYVEIDVADASEGGITFTIADSSKNNGKKTPDQFNKAIDCEYTVTIKDGKLTISFGDNVKYAMVGAEVVSDVKKFSGHAPSHFENSVTVDLPENCGDTVYLYTHIEALDWLTK